jgi:hypothetical protein
MSSAYLNFQHAYAQRTGLEEVSDSLIIYISDDCGDTWTRIFEGGEDGTGNFATHQIADEFWPETGSDWCMWGWGASCFNIDLTPWAGMHNLQIAFETYSFYGNPLMIDNVIISQFVGEEEYSTDKNELQVFPNPAHDRLSIVLPENDVITNLNIIDGTGRTVLNKTLDTNNKTLTIDIPDNLTTGVYLIKFNGTGNTYTKKIIIN